MNLPELSLRDQWLTLAEAGKILGIDPRTLERLIEARDVPVVQLERGIRVTLNDLDLLKKPMKCSSLASTFELGPLPPLPLEGESNSMEAETMKGKGKVMTITSDDAVTRTVTSLLTAKLLNDKNYKVCVVDLDFRNGALGFITGASTPTVINLKTRGMSEAAIKETSIHNEALGVDLFLAPKRPRNADELPISFVRDFAEELGHMYDYVILCSPSYSIASDERPAYEIADFLLHVIEPVVSSVSGLTRWVQEVTKPSTSGGMGISSDKIGIVVMNASQDVNMSSEKIQRSTLGLPIISAVPTDQVQIYGAVNRQSVAAVLADSNVASAFERIVTAVTP